MGAGTNRETTMSTTTTETTTETTTTKTHCPQLMSHDDRGRCVISVYGDWYQTAPGTADIIFDIFHERLNADTFLARLDRAGVSYRLFMSREKVAGMVARRTNRSLEEVQQMMAPLYGNQA